MSFGRLSRSAQPKPMSDINVTPMVDVMLVLLVIFIMAAPAMGSARLSVALPTHRAAQAEPGPAPSGTLLIDAQGGMRLNGQALSAQDAPARLAQWAQATPSAELVVQADRGVPYGRIVELMDMAQAAGVTQLGLAAQAAPAAKP
jgi:biopolymer transport protein ExbD